MSAIHRVPIILLDSTHFQEIRNTISSRPVAWDALVRSAEVGEFDASIAKKLDSILMKHSNSRSLDTTIKLSAAALYHLISTSNNHDAKRSAINLLSELLSRDQYFNDTINYFQQEPNALNILFETTMSDNRFDDQLILVAAYNMVTLLIQNGMQDCGLVERLLKTVNFRRIFKNIDKMDTCYICIRLLQELASVKDYRAIIWQYNDELLPVMFKIIGRVLDPKNTPRVVSTNSNNLAIQAQYYSLLSIWLLSYEPLVATELSTKYLSDFLDLLRLVKVTIKEKITRLSIAIILNCVAPHIKGRRLTIKNLLLLGNGLPILQQLSERKYGDDELREDLTKLQTILDSEYQKLTSFDEYVAELDSKLLVWSPPHIDNSFWSKNSNRFKEDNWKLFKQLLQVLKEFSESQESSDNIALQVALNDITHVVELHPDCVSILDRLNAKIIIMELLNHPDSKVKYEALKTTQAFVTHTFK